MGQQQPSLPQPIPIPEQTHHPALQLPSSTSVLAGPCGRTIMHTTKVENKQHCKKWEKFLRQYFSNVDTSMFYLPIRYHFIANAFCGGAGVISVEYQYFKTTLFREIVDRMGKRQRFREGELWRLLYVLVRAAWEVHRVDKKLDKIGLQLVFINTETREIKVGTGLSFFSDCQIQQILAPQQLTHSMGVHHHTSCCSSFATSQSFSIGIIVLCSAMLCPKPPSTAQHQDLDLVVEMQKQLREQKLYSQELVSVIGGLVAVDVRDRLGVEVVLRNLEKDHQFMEYYEQHQPDGDGKPTKYSGKGDNKYDLLDENSAAKIIMMCNQDIPNFHTPNFSASFQMSTHDDTFDGIEKVTSQYLPKLNTALTSAPITTPVTGISSGIRTGVTGIKTGVTNKTTRTLDGMTGNSLQMDAVSEHGQIDSQYSDFLAMVDSQLQKSRRTFPSQK